MTPIYRWAKKKNRRSRWQNGQFLQQIS